MKLGTWNCRRALHRKRDAIDELQCSVLVIQECAERELAQFGEYRFKGPEQMGFAVVSFDGWSIAGSPDDPHLPGMIFVRILNPSGEYVADLGGVWALTGTEWKYDEQFAQILEFVRGRTSSVPLVIAGDLNASAQGPSVAPHGANVANAAALGLVSVYHHANQIEHGSEMAMTLRWVGPGGIERGYHCDFVFASEELCNEATRFEVGDWGEWIESGRSDHAPVVAEFEM